MDTILCKKKALTVLMYERLHRLLHKVEIDRAVFFGIVARVWSVIAGPLTALLITIKFTPEYQGYYYTFASLLAMQIFVELGLGTVIIQFASHEWSKLRIAEDGSVSGDNRSLSRLSSLANITVKWYLVGGIIVAFGLGFGGYSFFLHSRSFSVSWSWQWFTLCFLTGITICLIPVWSLLEGCNQVSALYTYRFIQGIVSSLAIWIAILTGAKLWSASISVAAAILCGVIFIKYKYLKFIKSLLFAKFSDSHIDWRKEIFPMQWRIALSWMSGYFVFSFFTPVLFRYQGPVIAGQFGMTWSVVGAIGGIAGSWLSPKVPQFGMLIARKEYQKLDLLFRRTTKIFIFIALSLSVVVWLLIYLLNLAGHPISQRILSPMAAGIFLTAQVISTLSLPLAAYLRAHKKEPLLWLSILSGILTGMCTFILGKRYGVLGIAVSYLAVNLLVTPFVAVIWYYCRKQWHTDVPL